MRSKDGKDVPITFKDNYAALAAVKSSIADIKPGTFIGTATVTQPNSSMRSVEVVVFAESLRGTAEGHYPWDLGSNSMMTNGSIGNAVRGVEGQTVTVTYKGGEKKIDIPNNVPVVELEPGNKSEITLWPATICLRSHRQAGRRRVDRLRRRVRKGWHHSADVAHGNAVKCCHISGCVHPHRFAVADCGCTRERIEQGQSRSESVEFRLSSPIAPQVNFGARKKYARRNEQGFGSAQRGQKLA